MMSKRLCGVVLVALAGPGLARGADFVHDVQPLLLARCGSCHGGDQPQAGLAMHSRADLLKGGVTGPAIIPGNGKDSLLIQRVTGARPPAMPATGERLSSDEIGLLREWIDQGAPLGEAAAGARPPSSLDPRHPAPPAATIHGSANPVDHFVAAYFARRGVTAPPVAPDHVFARRAYLDLWGLLPSPEQLDEFRKDARADKRERLIARLLADRKNYSEHWISFWNDLLRNDEGVTYAGLRESISAWLLKALEGNLSYDRFVRALLDPREAGDPKGFLTGINWRGDVSASQTRPLQAAQNSAQVFLGINLKCNSCHDSFISHWKLKDAYGLASFFSDSELEIYRCDVATGEKAQPRFLYPELGGEAPSANRPLGERQAFAAGLFTSDRNGLLARTLVNRVWQRLLGRGLVEPVDEMEASAWDPGLLDWLASDFTAHGYDMQHLLSRLMTSAAYQLAATGRSKEDKQFTFRGPLVRRLTAEQFADGISAITGEWRLLQPSKPGTGTYVREWRVKSTPLTRALGRPIRDQVFTTRNTEATTLQALELSNGETLSDLLHRGARRLLGEVKPPPANRFDSGDTRSEKVVADVDITGARELRLLVEDVGCYDPGRTVAGWARAELVGPQGVTRLSELATDAKIEKRPLRIQKEDYADSIVAPVPAEVVYNISGYGFTRFRAVAGVDEASLLNEISPRVRFFVFTEVPDRQHLVAVAPGTPVATRPADSTPQALVTRLYRHALGRDPSPGERRVAREFLSPKVTAEGLEDLLWALVLSPEFQYLN